MIDRIEIFVTALSQRVQRIFSSGTYDTGPSERVLGKPVLVKIYAANGWSAWPRKPPRWPRNPGAPSMSLAFGCCV